jgi:DNA-binding Lrp family transcriptional regulator
LKQHLTDFQKKLVNALQDGLAVCRRPFAEIAKRLGSNEKEVLQQIDNLHKNGVIRRIYVLLNHRAIGLKSTLVAAHVPVESIQKVAEAINTHEGVSHNYLRDHHYNLWFTLRTQSARKTNLILVELSTRFGINFHSLPAKRVFKLDVRFDAEHKEQILLHDSQEVPKNKVVELNREQKLILSKLLPILKLTTEPFDMLCSEGLQRQDILRILKELIDKGVIRRIAAAVDHQRLGFVANVLFACEVPQDRIIQAGKNLAKFRAVSHCYERETFEGWSYNLFAMMHGRTMSDIQQVVSRFTESEQIDSFELLPTSAELKRQPIIYKF